MTAPRRLLVILLPVVGVGLAASNAQGAVGPTAPSAATDPPSVSTSYSGTIILADLGALGLGAVAGELAHSPWPAAVPWSLASPIVHVVHHHPGRAALSVLLHVGLPLVGALAGARIGSCAGEMSYESCYIGGLWTGLLIGAVVATSIDAAVLARLPEAGEPPAPSGLATRAAPAVLVGRDGALSLTWRGMF